ncbi:MAG: PAS domain-containing protein [Gammaproteobacteria bacterium]|nr:PAS domain-containing protein [Gammaproteobacteria bacterium]
MNLGGITRWRELAFTVLAAVPLVAMALLPVTNLAIPRMLHWLLLVLAVLWLLAWLAYAMTRRARRLRLLTSLLQALREGDYSLRAHVRGGLFGEVWREFNALASSLGGAQRHGIETNALLAQLLAALDFAVLVVDQNGRLVDMNPAAEQLLGEVSTRLVGRGASELGFSDWLKRASPFIDHHEFPGGGGPWEVRSLTFRRQGQPHRLLVITDVSHALREEERHAWRRLIRVLGHEINNSLGPIQSSANLLRERSAGRDPALNEGLELIERRSQALGTFIRRYAELARLPPPNPESINLADLIQRVASLETRINIDVACVEVLNTRGDPAQLEQALINLVRNAVDAALESGGGVRIQARKFPNYVLIHVEDDGPGIGQAENLFVPFFTTKPGGSGIGLVLARQIIEAHGGSLNLANREPAPGARASVRLPLR